eukprot:6160970-Alexandrium_andersonii.AAC.1
MNAWRKQDGGAHGARRKNALERGRVARRGQQRITATRMHRQAGRQRAGAAQRGLPAMARLLPRAGPH